MRKRNHRRTNREMIGQDVAVMLLGGLNNFIRELKKARNAIYTEYPEARSSRIYVRTTEFNHCVVLTYQRYATAEEIEIQRREREKKIAEIKRDLLEYQKEWEQQLQGQECDQQLQGQEWDQQLQGQEWDQQLQGQEWDQQLQGLDCE